MFLALLNLLKQTRGASEISLIKYVDAVLGFSNLMGSRKDVGPPGSWLVMPLSGA